ncbi:scavenger receptor class F member 1-like [Haliotis cracherodii]|uniref:scavenger receptor class F member 1-like n=1 Tax=Haliotis cracherodii TaxID=6455 RepID=UPI0039ECE9CA
MIRLLDDLASMDCLMAIAFMVASASAASTPCSNCDGNNVTCVDGVCLPRCVSVTSSGECLQCLDSRFYGKQCEHDCPDTCLNSRCQMDNTRVVCTEGCVAGKKGDNCDVNCPTACTQCERYGDGCTGPCQNPRYYGPHCRTPCSSSCTDGCNRITGECGSCEPGYIGDKCDVTCPPNCRDGCDKDTGECDSCEPGYTGDKCDVTCPPNCGDGCDKDTGECGSCVSGYRGKNCNDACPSSCSDGCDKEIGKCESCNPGNSGKYCNISCPTTCSEGCDQDGGCNEAGNNVVIVVVIIAGILGLVVLSVTIPLVCNQVQKRSKTRVVAPDIEQDISEHSYDYKENTFFDMEDKVADAVPVDDPNNTRSLRSSHPIGASAEVLQRANPKEYVAAPVMEGGSERLSNETIVVFLPKPSVHVHYINTTPSPKDSLLDYN